MNRRARAVAALVVSVNLMLGSTLANAREYDAEFTEDVDAFLPSAWVDAAVEVGRYELPPQETLQYVAAVDSSGGGDDAFTLAVVHVEGSGAARGVVQDVMKGWQKTRTGSVDLQDVARQICAMAQRYGIRSVTGDRYAAQWVRQAFQRHDIGYQDAGDKTAAYLEVEPLFAEGRIRILDHPRLARELRTLERRPRPGGRTIVDHPHGGHDDYANSLAIAAAITARERPKLQIYVA